jgi:hypothetical protein
VTFDTEGGPLSGKRAGDHVVTAISTLVVRGDESA